MTDSVDIMTTDSDIDTGTNDIMTDDSTDIMTGNSQPPTRTIGKPPKQDKDPNELKIASFRTKHGVWDEFSAKAELDGLTATDVLRAAMEQYLSGEYDPRIITPISITARHTNNILTRNDVLEIVNTAISTEQLNDSVMMAISTLSLCSYADVSTAISTAIDLLRVETNSSASDLEEFTRSQLATVRDEIKKSLSSSRTVTTPEPIATTPSNAKPDGDGNTKTWAEFFKMTATEAMTAKDAQKKSNIDKRNQQAEQGIQAAKEKGLGEWVVKRVAREFVRVDATLAQI